MGVTLPPRVFFISFCAFSLLLLKTGFSLRIGVAGEYYKVTGALLWKRQISLRKQAKFSRRILCSSHRILLSPMPNEHPA